MVLVALRVVASRAGRGQGSGVRGQGSGVRGQESGVRGQGRSQGSGSKSGVRVCFCEPC